MAQDHPKISIVTPCFNHAAFLEATIDSVLAQNYPNLEYIIIDGGSTDACVEIIKKYEKYLSFWCSEPDRGQYDAINKGFAKSTGEIMAWLNSDDMYFQGAFKTVASIMSSLEQVEWLTTLSPAAWDWQGFCTGFSSIPGYSREAFLDGYYCPWKSNWIGWIQQESTFWRRTLWSKIGERIRTEFNWAGDFDLWSRFFVYADLYGTPSPLGGFRLRFDQRVRHKQYNIECDKSLDELREVLGWTPNYYKRTLIQLKLHKVPKIREVVRAINGYTGQRIERRNQELPDGFWDVEEYKFP